MLSPSFIPSALAPDASIVPELVIVAPEPRLSALWDKLIPIPLRWVVLIIVP